MSVCPNIMKQTRQGTAGDMRWLCVPQCWMFWEKETRPQSSCPAAGGTGQAQVVPTGLGPQAAAPTDSTLPHKQKASAVRPEVFGLKDFHTKQKSTKEKVEPTRIQDQTRLLTPHNPPFPQTPSSRCGPRDIRYLLSGMFNSKNAVILCWQTRNNPQS